LGQAVLNRVGYSPEISHGMLVETAEHRKDLEKKTKPILDTLRSYQDLPPVSLLFSNKEPLSFVGFLLQIVNVFYNYSSFRIKLWLLWQSRTRKGSTLLQRSILKMYCIQLLQLRSDSPRDTLNIHTVAYFWTMVD
jgi:hypothetical protein